MVTPKDLNSTRGFELRFSKSIQRVQFRDWDELMTLMMARKAITVRFKTRKVSEEFIPPAGCDSYGSLE